MQIVLIRHGQTPGNALRRYIGRTDEPLSAEGVRALETFGTLPDVRRVLSRPFAGHSRRRASCFRVRSRPSFRRCGRWISEILKTGAPTT